MKDSAHALLEGVPEQVDVHEIGPDLASNIPVVEDVHHVHAWSLSQERSLLTLHARIVAGANPDAAIAAIQKRLAKRFEIGHVTVQVELESCTDDPSQPEEGRGAELSASLQSSADGVCGSR